MERKRQGGELRFVSVRDGGPSVVMDGQGLSLISYVMTSDMSLPVSFFEEK